MVWQKILNGLFPLLQETRKFAIFISLSEKLSGTLGGWLSVAAASVVKILCWVLRSVTVTNDFQKTSTFQDDIFNKIFATTISVSTKLWSIWDISIFHIYWALNIASKMKERTDFAVLDDVCEEGSVAAAVLQHFW